MSKFCKHPHPGNGFNKIIARLLLIVPSITFLLCALLITQQSCRRSESLQLIGTYRIYSEDPMVKLSISGQDIYIKISADNSIVYSTTINGRPMHHVMGKYTLDKKTNELAVEWESGNLPAKLKVEKNGPDHFIKIGNTIYMKEKIKAQ